MAQFNLYRKRAEIDINGRLFKGPPFSINFELTQELASFTKVSATLWNPNDETIAACEQKREGKKIIYPPVTIQAGYEDNFGIAGTGVCKKFSVSRDGTNRILKMEIQDNNRWWDQRVMKSYYNKKASEIISDLVGDRPNSISLGEDKFYKKFFARTIYQAVKTFYTETKSHYYFRNGTLVMEPRKFNIGRAFKLTYETGLVGTPERIDEPPSRDDKKKPFRGFKVKTLFIYGLNMFRSVEIDTPTTLYRGKIYRANQKFSTFDSSESEYLISDNF